MLTSHRHLKSQSISPQNIAYSHIGETTADDVTITLHIN